MDIADNVRRNRQSSSGFEFVLENIDNEDGTSVDIQDFVPVTLATLSNFFDDDGRIVDVGKFRETVFNGGCSSDIRIKVWPFLFEVYPFSSTKRERDHISKTNYFNYQALKERCKTQISVISIVLDDIEKSPFANLDPATLDSFKSMAEIFAEKQSIDVEFQDWFRVVDKDIPRTDIDHSYFHENSEYEIQMRNMLNTFGILHPEIGYVQGMNDILSRFLVVMQSETDAYWCFSNYMESVEEDFSEAGMVQKIEQVCNLLKDMEPDLYNHFSDCSVPDLLFCHRWLIVSFKREFEYEESLQYFEIVQSKHLTFDGHVALSAQDEQFKKEVLKAEGKAKAISRPSLERIPYALDVFVCVAVIMLKRQDFLKCKDASEVFTIACNIRGSLNLKEVHSKALGLFTKYCKKYTKENCASEKSSIFSEGVNHAATFVQSVSSKFQTLPNKIQTLPNKVSSVTQGIKLFFNNDRS